MEVLVTGAAGFIGAAVAEMLLARGDRVIGIDVCNDYYPVTLKKDRIARVRASATGSNFNFRAIDFSDSVALERDLADCAFDSVVHLGAQPGVRYSLDHPHAYAQANLVGHLNILELARHRQVRHLVYASSSSVYGDTPVLPKVETMEPLCRSPYAAAKLAGEQYVLAFARSGLIEGVALRYFNVFGARQSPKSAYAAVIPAFFDAALRAGTAEIHGDGEQTRDFTFVANVVEANQLAAFGPADQVSGWAVNCGAGARTSLNQLLALVERVTGRPVARRHAPPRPGDVRDSLASLERAGQVLGYRPLVGLEDGLRRTWEWFTA